MDRHLALVSTVVLLIDWKGWRVSWGAGMLAGVNSKNNYGVGLGGGLTKGMSRC